MSHITIPATGSGDATPEVATDQVGSAHYQYVKIADGTVGGSQPAAVDTLGNLKIALAAATALVGASVANFPAVQPVSGYLGASIAGGYVGASITNAGALSAASQVLVGGSATVYVASAPAQTLTGEVGASITNFPATQAVSGNVGASVGGYVGASIANLPATQNVRIASTSVTQPVSGNLTASVIGEIGASVTNWPTTQQVYVASTVTAPVSGYLGASIANLPATQNVDVTGGYVGASLAGAVSIAAGQQIGASVSNFPATQPVSGYLGASVAGGLVGASIANTPTVTLASSTIQVGVSVANYPTNIGSVSAQNVGGSSIAIPAAAPVAGLGASPYSFIVGASVNNINIKAAAGTLYDVIAMNTNANPRYLRLYDKATTPSPGTDIPRQTYVIPGATAGAGAIIPMPVGMLFAAGIGFAVTGGSVGNTDTTTTGLGDVVVNLAYS